MSSEERAELAQDVEQRLNELDFNLEISNYHDEGTSIVDVDIDSCDTDLPEDWDCQVEDVISDVVKDWGGWYSWSGSTISVSIKDE